MSAERELNDSNSEPQQQYAKGYGLWFNNEAYEILMGHPVVETNKDELTSSWISNCEGKKGVYWTEEEKELFFTLLSRRSRHDLATIAEELGTKSLVEVEQYNDLLFKSSQSNPGLVGMDDIPSAHEMSSEWIDMENLQSQGLEDYLVNNDEKDTNRIQVEDSEEGNYLLNGETNSLINIPPLIEIASSIYYNAPVDDEKPEFKYRPALRYLNHDLMEELEELVRWITEILVRECIVTTERRLYATTYAMKRIISNSDVGFALDELKFPKRFSVYWRNVCRRLNLKVRFGSGYCMDHDTLERYLDTDPDEYQLRALETGKIRVEDYSEKTEADEEKEESTDKGVQKGRLKGNDGGTTVASDAGEEEEEERLVNLETELLEKYDQSVAQAAESILIRFISTYDNPQLLSSADGQLIAEMRKEQRRKSRKRKITAKSENGNNNDAEEIDQERLRKFLKTFHSSGYSGSLK